MEPKKINLELTEEQASLISMGMELVARIGMGQLEQIDQIPFLGDRRRANASTDHEERDKAISSLKAVYFPELTNRQYHGMTNEPVDEKAKIAWDIHQVIRHALSWHHSPEGGWSIHFDKPLKVSNEPLPLFSFQEEEKPKKKKKKKELKKLLEEKIDKQRRSKSTKKTAE